MTKTEYTEQVKREMSYTKSALIRTMNNLYDRGLKREADRLGSIIGRLEYWQGSGGGRI